jgi:hypothetical protein
VTTVLHCGQEARFPAALTGTFNVRPQPVQGNSTESVSWEVDDISRNDEARMTNDEQEPNFGHSGFVIRHLIFMGFFGPATCRY